MDSYYVIDPATPDDAPVLLSLSPTGTPFGICLGKRLPMPERVIATFTRLAGLQTMGWLGNIFFMSPKVIEELKRLGEKHFFEFPITVSDETGNSEHDLIRAVVTLDNIECMDKKRSHFEVEIDDPNDIISIGSLVLDESRIPKNRHLFRVAEFPSALIASRETVDMLKAQKATGVKFVVPKQYRI